MLLRTAIFLVAALSLLCTNGCAPHTGGLRATTAAGQVELVAADVEEIYLKYDGKDHSYIAAIELNDAGKDKMGKLLGAGTGTDLTLYVGKRFLTKVPVMTGQIDRLLIKVNDQRSALDLLRDLSN